MSTKAYKCPICGDVERSLLPATVCSECGCDMKPVPCGLTVLRGCVLPIGHEGRCQAGTTALGNDLLAADVIAALKYLALDKDAPRDSRIAAIRQLAALAATPAPANPHIGSSFDDFLREEGIAPAEAREPVVPNAEDGDFDCPKAAAARACPCDRSEQSGPDGAPPSLHEAIAVFDHSASRTHPNGQTRAWAVIREHLSSHQQAVEALRARAESAEARLARVAGFLNTCVDVIEEGLCARQSYDYRARAEGCAEQIKELLLAAAIAPQEGEK